jgi:hypothetical protein
MEIMKSFLTQLQAKLSCCFVTISARFGPSRGKGSQQIGENLSFSRTSYELPSLPSMASCEYLRGKYFARKKIMKIYSISPPISLPRWDSTSMLLHPPQLWNFKRDFLHFCWDFCLEFLNKLLAIIFHRDT